MLDRDLNNNVSFDERKKDYLYMLKLYKERITLIARLLPRGLFKNNPGIEL